MEPDSGLETRGHSRPRGAAETPRAAPPLCGSGLAGRRRPSPAPLTHLRVQRHQLHERPGLLELGERHRAAAEPPALLPAAPGCAASGPRIPAAALRPPRAPEPLALWLGRPPPPPPRHSHFGSLRHPAPPRPLATCAGAGRGLPRPLPHGAAFPARTPAPNALGSRPRLHTSPWPTLGPAHWRLCGYLLPGLCVPAQTPPGPPLSCPSSIWNLNPDVPSPSRGRGCHPPRVVLGLIQTEA